MDGWASIELTSAAMLGFRVSPPRSSFFSLIFYFSFSSLFFYFTSGRVILSYLNTFSFLLFNIIVYCYIVSTCRRMGDGCSHEHDRLSEDLGTHLRGEDRVDPTLKDFEIRDNYFVQVFVT